VNFKPKALAVVVPPDHFGRIAGGDGKRRNVMRHNRIRTDYGMVTDADIGQNHAANAYKAIVFNFNERWRAVQTRRDAPVVGHILIGMANINDRAIRRNGNMRSNDHTAVAGNMDILFDIGMRANFQNRVLVNPILDDFEPRAISYTDTFADGDMSGISYEDWPADDRSPANRPKNKPVIENCFKVGPERFDVHVGDPDFPVQPCNALASAYSPLKCDQSIGSKCRGLWQTSSGFRQKRPI